MYNGHKRVHGIIFQSVVTPNGLITNLSGPFEGKSHDSVMLHESDLLNESRQVAFYNGQPLCLYANWFSRSKRISSTKSIHKTWLPHTSVSLISRNFFFFTIFLKCDNASRLGFQISLLILGQPKQNS